MAYPVPSSQSIPAILPGDLCRIINSYLGCVSEAKEALYLQNSQDILSLDKAKDALVKEIWNSFTKNIAPRNHTLSNWLQKNSFAQDRDFEKAFGLMEVFIRDVIENAMRSSGKEEIKRVEAEFLNRPINLQRLEALSNKMKEAEEVESLRKIVVSLGKAIHFEDVVSLESFETLFAMQHWIEEHKEAIAGIEVLDLSGLDMTHIPEMFLHVSLPVVKNVNLSCNKIKSLPQNFGSTWLCVKEVRLVANELESLPPFFGDNWQELTEMWLQENNIQSLQEGFGQAWSQLSHICLQGNKFQTLPSDFGNGWPHLSEIWLQDCSIQSLNETFGEAWTELKRIWLGRNRLEAASASFGKNWVLIKEIYLQENSIGSVPEGFGKNWSRLVRIDLCRNRIRSLPFDFGDSWSLLQKVRLNQNPLRGLREGFKDRWPGEVEVLL